MNEQVEKILAPIKSFWEKQNKKRRIVMISVLAGIVLIALVIVIILNVKQYTTLYSGLSQEETVEVMKVLQEKQIDYKTEGNGSTILVEQSQEPLIRMQLAMEGHPKTAPDYGLYDTSIDFMTTDSERRTYEIFQAQERLQKTIATIKGINSVIVTLVPPEDSTYVWETNKSEASASVTVSMQSGYSLDAAQVSGIKRLISTAVRGLKSENIAVIDAATSKELASADEKTYVDVANFKLDIEKKLQEDVENNILKILVPIYGKQHVTVAVKSFMNLDKTIKEIITYSSPNDDGKGIVESEHTLNERVVNADEAGGVVGAEGNADLPNYNGVVVGDNELYYKDQRDYEYLVNKITEQITGQSPVISDMTVAVSVDRKQVELTEIEREDLSQAIANASGVLPEKVSVFNAEFNTLPQPGTQPGGNLLDNQVLVFSMSAVAILLLIGLILIIIINKRIKKKKEAQLLAEAEAAAAELAAATGGMPFDSEDMPNMLEDLKNVPESKEQALKKEIQQFTEENPEIVAQLLRTWLKGDEEDG